MREPRDIPTAVKARVSYRSQPGWYMTQYQPCEVCKANAGPVLEYHHIIPYEHGGEHSEKNLIKLCPTCHAFVSRDRIAWATWPKTGLYEPEVAQRLALLADIQHEPPDIFDLASRQRTTAWDWLEALTGISREDLPRNASWGTRYKREAI